MQRDRGSTNCSLEPTTSIGRQSVFSSLTNKALSCQPGTTQARSSSSSIAPREAKCSVMKTSRKTKKSSTLASSTWCSSQASSRKLITSSHTWCLPASVALSGWIKSIPQTLAFSRQTTRKSDYSNSIQKLSMSIVIHLRASMRRINIPSCRSSISRMARLSFQSRFSTSRNTKNDSANINARLKCVKHFKMFINSISTLCRRVAMASR